jgi:primosomal protein N' (replication factor Y) (superfamily II helicase)
MFARVIVDIKHEDVNQLYDYIIPEEFLGVLSRGMRVIVPFGTQKRLGFVVEITNQSHEATKSIIECLDVLPVIDEELFLMIEMIMKEAPYLISYVFSNVIPSELLVLYEKHLTINNEEIIPESLLPLFKNKKSIKLSKKDIKLYPEIKKYIHQGVCKIETKIKEKQKAKVETYYRLNINHRFLKAHLYEDIIDVLKDQIEVTRKEMLQLCSASKITTLLKHEVIFEDKKEVKREIKHHFKLEDKKVILNQEQNLAFETIKSQLGQQETFLLKGITGSGKTEIYLSLIEEVIQKNQTTLILVPEINLIAPMAFRLKSRFNNVAIYHSNLSSGEKYDQYHMILNKHAQVILGTRSAVFLPIFNLGLIIVDEEHDQSYIQTEGMYYDAKEILKLRSQYHQIPIVFGSATPSIVSMYHAKENKYKLLELNSRPNLEELPKIYYVNMTDELKQNNTSIFSRLLLEKMKDRLKKKEQIILLFNRKGYAPFVMCRSCGHVPNCPSCDISLTYYKDKSLLKCHYCGYEKPFDQTCESCQKKTVKEVGVGIEYVFEQLKKALPEARVLRLDQNVMRTKDAHEIYWKSFLDYEFDILLGTQMISKGLDFPKVTLVGILMADSLLKIPSYQASELTYNMLTQTTGRSGRFLKGEAVIQGYDLSHYAISSCSTNYDDFYKEAIFRRKISGYEPFYHTALMLFEGASYLKTYQNAFHLKKELTQAGFLCIGPSLAIKKKVKENYRFILTIKSEEKRIDKIKYVMDLCKIPEVRMKYHPYLDLI